MVMSQHVFSCAELSDPTLRMLFHINYIEMVYLLYVYDSVLLIHQTLKISTRNFSSHKHMAFLRYAFEGELLSGLTLCMF